MTDDKPRDVATWYFVGATFIFIAPVLFFSESGLWLRVIFIVAGVALMAAGFVELRKERARRRR